MSTRSLDQLKKLQTLPPVLLLISQSAKITEESMIHYREILEQKGIKPEEISLNGLDADPSTFHAELSTIPMFNTTRVILIRHCEGILKKISQNKTVLPYFIRDLHNIPPETHLIFHTNEKKLPKDFHFLEESAVVIEEQPLKERDLPAFISGKCHQMDFEIDEKAISLLSTKYSLNPEQIEGALDKLFLSCLNEKKIEIADIEEVCFDIEGDLIFTIIDHISRREIDRSINLFNKHKIADGNGFAAMLFKFFSEVVRYLNLQEAGIPVKEIHNTLELNTSRSFIFQKNEERFKAASRLFSGPELSEIMTRLFELDKRLKENSDTAVQKAIIVFFIASLKKENFSALQVFSR